MGVSALFESFGTVIGAIGLGAIGSIVGVLLLRLINLFFERLSISSKTALSISSIYFRTNIIRLQYINERNDAVGMMIFVTYHAMQAIVSFVGVVTLILGLPAIFAGYASFSILLVIAVGIALPFLWRILVSYILIRNAYYLFLSQEIQQALIGGWVPKSSRLGDVDLKPEEYNALMEVWMQRTDFRKTLETLIHIFNPRKDK